MAKKTSKEHAATKGNLPGTATDWQELVNVIQRARTYVSIDENSEVDVTRLRVKAKSHIPEMARAAADAVDNDPSLFDGLPFTSTSLRATEEEVRRIATIKGMIDDLSTDVGNLLLSRRGDLYDQAYTVLGIVRSSLDHPLTTPARQAAIRQSCRGLLSVVEGRQAGLRAVRGEKDAIFAEADKKVASVSKDLDSVRLENKVLRGEALASEINKPATVAARSRRKGRR